jgi:hypothetical protein
MNPLTFKPNDQEAIWLEDNKVSWSEFCHASLTKAMKNHKFIVMEKMQLPLFTILLGILFFVIAAVSTIASSYVVVSLTVMSIFIVSFGIFSMVGVIKKNE